MCIRDRGEPRLDRWRRIISISKLRAHPQILGGDLSNFNVQVAGVRCTKYTFTRSRMRDGIIPVKSVSISEIVSDCVVVLFGKKCDYYRCRIPVRKMVRARSCKRST